MSTPVENPNRNSSLRSIGVVVIAVGAAFAGTAVGKQIMNTVEGRHYYDRLGVGLVFTVIGLILHRIGRRPSPSA